MGTAIKREHMADALKQALLDLIISLDSISNQFEFITDSTVRERMSDFIRDFYLKRIAPPPSEYDFATNSSSVDQLHLRALSTYVVNANRIADERRLTLQDRLNAFQDEEVTNDQRRSYDEYFGYWRPGSFANG